MSEIVKRKFKRNQEKMAQWQAMLLLNYIINVRGKSIPLASADEDDRHLDPILSKLCNQRMLDVDVLKNQYIPTQKGRDALTIFLKRYDEMNQVFGVFQAVCLSPVNKEAGETNFALEKIYDMSEEGFAKFRKDSKWNWQDLRFAVIEFKNLQILDPAKKIDPVEMVFMNFIENNRFDYEKNDWQFDLKAGLIWEDMYEIAESLITISDLTYTDVPTGKIIKGEDVIREIVEQGAQITLKLMDTKLRLDEEEDEAIKKAEEARREDRRQEDYFEEECVVYEETEYIVITPLVYDLCPVSYYTSYYDPFYVGPVFYDPYWF
jgi:hypothetical protein